MGYTPGPMFKEVLLQVLYAKIDGKVQTLEDEKEFAVNYLQPTWSNPSFKPKGKAITSQEENEVVSSGS